jgi:CHAT domain/Tetratricopeptide repeat
MGTRETRFAAVAARLQRVAAGDNLSLVLHPDAVREAQRLAEVGGASGDLTILDALGWLYWFRSQALPGDEGRRELATAISMLTPCFIANVGDQPPPLLATLADQAIQEAGSLLQMIRESRDQVLVSSVVDLWRRITAATPDSHPGRAGRMSCLGIALHTRHVLTGSVADLDAAVEAGQAAVDAAAADAPTEAGMRDNLDVSLRARFALTQTITDLDAVIRNNRAMVGATPASGAERAMALSRLAHLLRERFNRTGAIADLDSAVEAGRAAVDAAPPSDPRRVVVMMSLELALQDRFTRTGALADLEDAINLARASLAVTATDDPSRVSCLANLGVVLWRRYRRTAELADLDAAIDATHAAIDAAAADDPDLTGMLSNLGGALHSRFERTGALADLDAAIETTQAAIDAAPADHPSRAMYLSNLGTALRDRVKRTGALADLDAAIEICRAAVDATPADHPNRGMYLSSLAGLWQERFQRVGALADLDAAIRDGRAAIDATPADHPDRAGYLVNLCGAQRQRFAWTGAPADLDAAICSGQAAIDATPADHPSRPSNLTNLGNALRDRSGRTGSATDLDAAIQAQHAAVEAIPADHPDRAMYLTNLGTVLRDRSERNHSAADSEAALTAFAAAAESGLATPTIRIQAARLAAALAAPSAPSRAADLLEAAIRLLPEAAPRQVARSDQQHAMARFTGLAGDAAALALADTTAASRDRAARALRLLEAGQAVLLNQALDTRSDLTDLRQQHPALASRFIELRGLLDQQSPSSGPTADRHRMAGEFARVIERIRAMDGFASFGLPPDAVELRTEAAAGPVVTFSLSDHRSDALLVTEGNITALELPGLARATVLNRVRSFYQILEAVASSPDSAEAQRRLHLILEWLWDAAAAPVLDALGYRAEPAADAEWPRMWWVTGGLLGLLPLHAAGYHTDLSRRTVMDRVVSSATPTIRALRHARQHDPADVPGQALIVAMPVTPGLPHNGPLPNVAAEADMVSAKVPRHILLTEPSSQDSDAAPDRLPTKAAVLNHLPACPVAHFACHGASHPTDPSQSLLLLHDHERDPLTVASLAPVQLDNAQLAYLSACRTAFTPASGLLDEAIHLTTAFQLAGFPHVIGTLWEINDVVAVEIAEDFYTTLGAGPGTLNPRNAARALHHAVRSARDRHLDFPALWAGYLHAGA